MINLLSIFSLRFPLRRVVARNLPSQIQSYIVVPSITGGVVPPYPSTDHQVLEIIIRSPGTAFDEVVLQCPNLT
jgi:hypothetical protein